MKKILIPGEEEYARHKANLHAHTTVSDGRRTPEEIKKIYKDHGYRVVAFTDHNMLIPHPELCDSDFIALNGAEIDFNEFKPGIEDYLQRESHFNIIGLTEDTLLQPCYHRTKYCEFFDDAPYRPLVRFDKTLPDYERDHSVGCINTFIKTCRDAGFFVIYNHPEWNGDPYEDYSQYLNLNAMEIKNSGCFVGGYDEDNGHVYDDFLRLGRKMYCIAADDTHSKRDGTGRMEYFGGYVYIWTNDFTYRGITKALEEGRFFSVAGEYNHLGPEFKRVTVEDGVLTVTCTPVRQINVHFDIRRRRIARDFEPGTERFELKTHAEFKLPPDASRFRITLTDDQGYKAYTNEFYYEDL